jgi:hypothetical protein
MMVKIDRLKFKDKLKAARNLGKLTALMRG